MIKAAVGRVLGRLGYRIHGTRLYPRQLLQPELNRALAFDDVICRRMFETRPELRFIQVGVFDGVTHDPLRKYIVRCGWRGVLLEPQPGAAKRLRDLYAGNDRIVVLQAALDREPGERTLFTVESENAPAWAGGLASFDRTVIAKHSALIPGLEAMIKEEAVRCIAFDEVLERLGPGTLDLLQIDTEGADAQILALFPFDRVKPAIVHWEVKHLGLVQREGCLERLAGFGYRFAPSGDEDMMAVLN